MSRLTTWKLPMAALAALACLGCTGPFDGPGPDPDPDPDGDGDDTPPAAGMGMVTVTGSTECSASLDAATSPPELVAVSDADGQNGFFLTGVSEDDSLGLSSALESLEPLGEPPVDTTYVRGPEQLHVDAVNATCDEGTYQLFNEEGETAADLTQLTTLQIEVSNWRTTDTVTRSGADCRGDDSSSSCRVHTGVCDVYFEAVWDTGAGDEVSVVFDVQDIDGGWYESL